MAAIFAAQTTMINNSPSISVVCGILKQQVDYYNVIISLYFSNLKSENLKAFFFSGEQGIFVGPIISLQNRKEKKKLYLQITQAEECILISN